MPSICQTPIKGTTIRIVQLDVCGNPVTGSNSHVVITNSFTQVQMAPQYEAAQDYFEKTADGQVGVNDIDPPVLKRMQLTTDLMSIDPDMTPYVLSARELLTAAPVSGTGFGVSEGPSSAHFSMEVWQRCAGAGACSPSGLAYYIYNAWPHCRNVQIGQYTIGLARSALQFICDTAAPGFLWLDGPGSSTWLPAGTPSVGTLEHWLWNITTTPPPAAQCGFIALV